MRTTSTIENQCCIGNNAQTIIQLACLLYQDYVYSCMLLVICYIYLKSAHYTILYYLIMRRWSYIYLWEYICILFLDQSESFICVRSATSYAVTSLCPHNYTILLRTFYRISKTCITRLSLLIWLLFSMHVLLKACCLRSADGYYVIQYKSNQKVQKTTLH